MILETYRIKHINLRTDRLFSAKKNKVGRYIQYQDFHIICNVKLTAGTKAKDALG